MCIEYQSEKAANTKAVFTPDGASDSRRKLWHLPESCHCMIIGTCLKLAEVKSVCNRCDYPIAESTDYELHRFVVEQAGFADSIVARRVHKLLELKFRADISRLRGKQTEKTLMQQWNVMRDAGWVGGALWATFTHPACTKELVSTIFGEVHMLSHLTGRSIHEQAQALPKAQRSIESLERKLKNQHLTASKEIAAAQERIARLEKLNTELRLQLKNPAALQGELNAINQRDHEIVKSALRDRNGQLREITVQLNTVEAQYEKKRDDCQRLAEDNEKLEQVIEYLAQKNAEPAGQCNKSLSGKCLLLLGGMPSQCKHFKAYVEANDGDFLHHDGGVGSNISKIDTLISQADAVLCPVDEVSHSAMLRAREACKSADKPLVFLPKSSLAAFMAGLRELSPE